MQQPSILNTPSLEQTVDTMVLTRVVAVRDTNSTRGGGMDRDVFMGAVTFEGRF